MNKLKRTEIVISTIFFALVLFQSCENKVAERPNILFILADDHTTQAVSCYGGIFAEKAKTVNIDKLAQEGMMFTNCFCTNSIYSPSRATILTGKYNHKNGVYLLNKPFDSD